MNERRQIARLPFYLLVGFCFLLTAWWIFFQVRTSGQIEKSQLHSLQMRTHKALTDFAPLLRRERDPAQRRSGIQAILDKSYPELELVSDEAAAIGEARLAPFLSPKDPLHDLVLRAKGSATESILAEGRGTRLMFFTEGATFLIVLLVGSFLFYRSVSRELLLHAQHELFLRSATHELKTPLAALKLGLQSLALGRMDPERSKHYLELLEGQVDRLEFEIENMLLIAEGREKDVQKQVGNPSEDVSAIIDEFATRARGREVELELSGQGQGLQVLRDPLTFRQTLRNLLDNAIKYSPQGGRIQIEIQGAAQSEAQSRIQGDCAQLKISIQDEGPGVPPQERERIFDKFFRGETGSSDALGGTGLGLFFAAETMSVHGGSIRLEENDKPGSCFVLTLPLHGGAAVRGTAVGGTAAGGAS
jgi:signal transduction histidine kinase